MITAKENTDWVKTCPANQLFFPHQNFHSLINCPCLPFCSPPSSPSSCYSCLLATPLHSFRISNYNLHRIHSPCLSSIFYPTRPLNRIMDAVNKKDWLLVNDRINSIEYLPSALRHFASLTH